MIAISSILRCVGSTIAAESTTPSDDPPSPHSEFIIDIGLTAKFAGLEDVNFIGGYGNFMF